MLHLLRTRDRKRKRWPQDIASASGGGTFHTSRVVVLTNMETDAETAQGGKSSGAGKVESMRYNAGQRESDVTLTCATSEGFPAAGVESENAVIGSCRWWRQRLLG
jgi:hypothetical protein